MVNGGRKVPDTIPKANTDNTLTGRTFRVTVASYFFANILTVMGSLINGFVAGNTMDEAAIAAVGLVSPAIILFAFIGTTVGISFQVGSVRCLSRGDLEGAGRTLTETLLLGTALSIIVMIVTLAAPDPIIKLIGVEKGSVFFPLCAEYIRGTAVGIPAMTAMAILTRGVYIDGNSKVALLSVGAMILTNVETVGQAEALLPMMSAKTTARTPKGIKQLKVTA